MWTQALEKRQLLAVTAVFDDGTLAVTGNGEADSINVTVSPGGLSSNGLVTVKSSGTVIYNSSTGGDMVELIRIRAGAGNDFILVGNNEGIMDIVIEGQEGDDVIYASSFHVKGATIRGGDGADEVHAQVAIGGSRGCVIDGDGGNDKMLVKDALGAPSTIRGGAGDDSISVTSEPMAERGHTVSGGTGNDTLRGGVENDKLAGNDGNDIVVGGDGEDLLTGGEGHDRLYGNAGDDSLLGGAGHDYLFGGDGEDLYEGAGGRDSVAGETGDDSVFFDDIEAILVVFA
jgi:Ca2+-binding RTX toxin-like protein